MSSRPIQAPRTERRGLALSAAALLFLLQRALSVFPAARNMLAWHISTPMSIYFNLTQFQYLLTPRGRDVA